jgi:hypothetical protein
VFNQNPGGGGGVIRTSFSEKFRVSCKFSLGSCLWWVGEVTLDEIEQKLKRTEEEAYNNKYIYIKGKVKACHNRRVLYLC